jgi:hypothetical protein
MESVFNFIYETLVGKTSDPTYREGIFLTIGVATFLINLALALLFYLLLGRWKAVWYKLSHWILTLLLSIGICSLVLSLVTDGEVDVNGEWWMILVWNTIIATVWYFIFSMLLKRFSIFPKYIPF